MNRPFSPSRQSEQVGQLIIAAVLVIFLPQLPLGQYLLYPLVLLTTWFHEMGHGLTAMAMGWEFNQLVLLPDGSGVAESYPDDNAGGGERALVAAGGPLGPSLVGALLIFATRHRKWWRPVLYGLAGALLVSTVIWVSSTTGQVVLPLLAVALGAIAYRARDGLARFSLQFLGMLSALSMFQDFDYLFSHSAVIAGQPMLSDTGAMEEAMGLPYWLWAILIIIVSAGLIGGALKLALAEDGARPLRAIR